MSEKVEISVIIPIYNTPANILKSCLNSFVNQTFHEMEVIMVDDGSASYCATVCDDYARKYAHFHVIHKANGGVSIARNTGIQFAVGGWIAFADADDWVEPDLLAHLYQVAQKTDADCVFCDCMVEYPNRNVPNHFFYTQPSTIQKGTDEYQQLLLQLICKNSKCNPPEIAVGVPWAKLYRKKLLDQEKIVFSPKLKRLEDSTFNLFFFQAASRIAYTDKLLYHYRKFNLSASNRFSPYVVSEFEAVFVQTWDYIKRYQPNRLFLQGYYSQIVMSFHSYFKYCFFHPKNQTPFRETKMQILKLMKREPYNIALENLDYAELPFPAKLFTVLLKHRYFFLLRELMALRRKSNCA